MMDHQGELGRLEDTIERLLAGFDALLIEKKQLEYNNGKQKAEILALQQEISALKEEKRLISKRLDSLLAYIEKWEEENIIKPEQTKDVQTDKKTEEIKETSSQFFSLTG